MAEPIYDYRCYCADCSYQWLSDGEPDQCPNCGGSGTVSFTRLGAAPPVEEEKMR